MLRDMFWVDRRMKFRFCRACNCYEYDCHGLKGCIKRR